MRGVAIASSTKLGADAGATVAEEGGNAVDAAIAAALVSSVAEPGICALGSGGFVTVWEPEGEPITIDGYVEMPGRGLPPDAFGGGKQEISIEYGGGVDLMVGHGTVATPGSLAACSVACEQYGRLPWREVVEPAYQHAKNGFALTFASYKYLVYAHDLIFGWNEQSFRALHREDGTLKQPGELIRIDHLADSLRMIADHGAGQFYRGEMARLISEDCLAGGGILTRQDLAAYEPIVRPALVAELDDWLVATNPPPAVGGAVLIAMLQLMRGHPRAEWTAEETAYLVRVQEAVLDYRHRHLDLSEDLETDIGRMLDEAVEQELLPLVTSPSTVHTSAVDADGLACSVTQSAGYGSGVMPPGTGIWMNNCLGELELNRRGYHGWPVGTRLVSNMAPTAARRRDGAVLSIGSPGADRITTAILQTLVNHLHLGMSLSHAIDHPRLHVELVEGSTRVAYEPGMPVDELDVESRRFQEISMYFGGVGAALCEPARGFQVAADPRRGGGTAIGGWPHE
jgi:gamma-glutamyltranspeptidase/glutathione hydrolase